jgi:hypothetical protein
VPPTTTIADATGTATAGAGTPVGVTTTSGP